MRRLDLTFAGRTHHIVGNLMLLTTVFPLNSQKSVSNKELKKIEDLVCHMIRRSLPVERTTLPLDDALSLDGVVYLENEVRLLCSLCFGGKRIDFSNYPIAQSKSSPEEVQYCNNMK